MHVSLALGVGLKTTGRQRAVILSVVKDKRGKDVATLTQAFYEIWSVRTQKAGVRVPAIEEKKIPKTL